MFFADLCTEVGVTFAPVPFLNGAFVVINVSDPLEPIVFASEGFQALTGYSGMEQKGRKCSFLQGPETDPADIDAIRAIVKARSEGFVKILNYRADGTKFMNVLHLQPLMPTSGALFVRYMIGCQCDASDARGRKKASSPSPESHAGSKLRLRLIESGQSFVPNASPVHINGEHFEGLLYFKTYTSPPDPRVAPYFEGVRRKFEIQLQGRFKRPLVGDVFLNAYLAEPMDLGNVNPGVVKVINSCLRKMTRDAVITMGDRPSIALPVNKSLDRLIVTEPGQPPPAVGVDMFPECPLSILLNENVTYGPGKTYSFSFHSAYLDFEEWTVVNLPGIRSVGLQKFWGDQPLHVALKVLPFSVPPEDIQKCGTYLVDVVVMHSSLPCYSE